MRRGISAVMAATAGVSLALLPVPAAGATSIPIECGTHVPDLGHLTHNLVCPTVAITIGPAATIDLRGYTLRGPGRGTASQAIVLHSEDGGSGSGDLTLLNGTIDDWGRVVNGDVYSVTTNRMTLTDIGTVFDSFGVNLTSSDSRFERNGAVVSSPAGGRVDVRRSTFVDNIGVFYEGPYSPNVYIEASTFRRNDSVLDISEGQVTIVNSTFRDGVTAISSFWGGTRISGSTFRGYETAVVTNWLPGARPAVHHDQFTGNTFHDNGVALQLGVNANVAASDFTRNRTGVLSQTYGAPNPVSDVTLTTNTFTRNGDGVIIDTVVHLQGNRATRNTGYGFNVPMAVDLGGNVATRNGINCVGLVC
ncbi:hypothetical protein [Actinotalea solisilvae]|uniref:hypothetical protein n=1 Tax=Actinotalea solisilvae TaxID=2072922 RepID=UPI0018F1EFBB|nr:hypothetical protein [Actinotalea solisilvae]